MNASMAALAGPYLFLLGLASGFVILAITAYRRVSPRWLRWLLMAAGLFMLSRYATLALFTHPEAPQRFWALRHCWFASSIGLTLPSVFAIDQLVKHPAMSPKTLLRWFTPFLIVYALVMLFGSFTPRPDPWVGWTLGLGPVWRVVLLVTQAVFVLGFIGICVMVMLKFPSRSVRLALLGLAAGHGYLGVDGLILALDGAYFRPFLYSEMVTLLAIWHAYETATALQETG